MCEREGEREALEGYITGHAVRPRRPLWIVCAEVTGHSRHSPCLHADELRGSELKREGLGGMKKWED